MKSSLLTKAALCICPPVAVVTTVATVPPVRHAVHHLTQPARPHHAAAALPPCVPVTNRTLASQLPSVLTPDETPPVAFTALAPPGGGVTPVVGPTPLNPPTFPSGPGVLPGGGGPNTPAVPEPAVWFTMVLGFGMVGAGVRVRRRYALRSRAALAGGGTIGGIGAFSGGGLLSGLGMLAAGAPPVQASARLAHIGSRVLNSATLAKTALCVCPPVAMAVATAALPPVRHAVYSATAPHGPVAARPVPLVGPRPCVPIDVPTAAQAVQQGGDELAVFKPTPAWPS